MKNKGRTKPFQLPTEVFDYNLKNNFIHLILQRKTVQEIH